MLNQTTGPFFASHAVSTGFRWSRVFITALIAITATLSMAWLAPPSRAEVPGGDPVEQLAQLSDADLTRAQRELQTAAVRYGVRQGTVVEDGKTYVLYNLEGLSIGVPQGEPSSGRDETARPSFTTQFVGTKIIITFTPAEQKAVITGGAAGIAAAICAIPTVGWASCVVVQAAINGAGAYISDSKTCKKFQAYIEWWRGDRFMVFYCDGRKVY